MAEALQDDLWTPYKNLYKVVNSFLSSQVGESSISNLDYVLRKHKQNFLNLLKNPQKNAKSREEIRQGTTEGINLPGLGHTQLSKDLVDETIIISDMYNLNEYIALELVCTAQQQMPNHPGLPRGLVAVLLYYDGRKTLVSILKMLFQVRQGISWCTEMAPEVTKFVTNYTDRLVEDGILDKIVECLESLEISKELEVLTSNRALGPPKHHRQVLDLFEEVRLSLAVALFNWSAQCGLSKNVTVKLIKYLSKYQPATERGGIDDVTLALQMALLYAVDLSVIQKREDGEDVVRNVPMICEHGYAEAVFDALIAPWQCEGLQAMLKFALGISLATLRLTHGLQMNAMRVIDQDESLVDEAIQMKIFDFIHYTLFDNKTVFTTEFYFRKMHVLLTDFIELMHSKVKELRAGADETAKTVQCYIEQGIDPPINLCHNFETLLLAVGKLYENDRLRLGLSLEYWGPMEVAGNYPRASSRSVSLFKFIRLAGELLPPILFIPYLKMLAGLSSCQQSARNAFNLLKQGSGVSGSTTLSWDHFFSSLTRYYINLRQEQHPNTDTIYRNRALNRNISPQELAGLQAVLCVVRAVAENDEVARIALCEHPTWAPLNTLIGLVTCSCAINLKTDLLLTLSALGRSKETALQLWNILESSQIVATIPSTNTISTRGIESELEQIESRNETYPLTQAMLDFLYTLSSTAIPKNLGAGPRTPGLDPYLTFILDTVFGRFYSRIYSEPAEKWMIAEKCLRLMELFVRSYEPASIDFPSTRQLKEENSPPGFHIMLQMNTESEFLRLILHIVDEACALTDTFAPYPGKSHLQKSVLHCMRIIERCLARQDAFFEAHFSSNCSILLTGINKLLLGINRRTGQPDHMLNVTKFVCYNAWLPSHALLSVRILGWVLKQPNVNNHLIGMFSANEKVKNEIRHGFVECLESEWNAIGGATEDTIMSHDDDDDTGGGCELAIKEQIVTLLHECLPQPAPNMSHYLLGFDLHKDTRHTKFQQPGVMNFPTNCTKSLTAMLDYHLEVIKSGTGGRDAGHENLIASAYTLLYSLCLNSRTSEPILRFLRTCNDFLCRHISALPFKNSANNPRILKQMTGLLKCVAIELKMSAANSQIRQFANLCQIMLGFVQSSAVSDATVVGNNYSMFHSSANLMAEISAGNRKPTEHGTKTLICQLLDSMNFEIKPLDMPRWDYFENPLMAGLFQSCEVPVNRGGAGGRNGPRVIDIKKLHDVLRDELNTVQTTMAAGQRQLILQEIESILMFALQLNEQKNAVRSTVKFLEAWGQLTEVLFSVAPAFAISSDVKQSLIIEILQALLNKVVPAQTLSELANLSSATVLLLLVNLRHCYRFKATNESTPGNQNSVISSGPQKSTTIQIHTTSNTLSLKYILKNIIEWLIITGVASQKLRINLYASLLNYMHIVKGTGRRAADHLKIQDEFFVSRLDRSMATTTMPMNATDNNDDEHVVDQSELAVEVFTSFGDKLFDILCHDCTGGHDVCKTLAFSCVDMLLEIDSMANFIHFISKRGYLAHLIDSLLKSDNQLCQILEATPDSLKALYVYESKMATLSRIAGSYAGAELLLEQKMLGAVSGMRVYDLHPDFQLNSFPHHQQYNSFVPPVEVRYRQILFPALSLCDVILSTLGSENHSAINQILHFLLSHGEMIEVILRAGTPTMSLGLLEELSAVTGLIARSTNQEVTSINSQMHNLDVGAHLYRLQKLMLTLMPRFILSDVKAKTMYQSYNKTTSETTNEKEQSRHSKLVLEVACNLALYARNSISNFSADRRTINILFSPNIHDVVAASKENNVGSMKLSPNLGIVLAQLKSCIDHFGHEKSGYDNILRDRSSYESQSLDRTAQETHSDALTESLKVKQEELKLCTYLAEQCLYLLWAHVDYYMLRAVPVNSLQQISFNNTSLNDSMMTSADAGWKVTSEDISSLKRALVQTFSESFCRQVVATAQDTSAIDAGYMEALIRRIKRLVQLVPVQ